MDDSEGRLDRIKDKIATSGQRLRRDAGPSDIPERPQLPDAYPPESYRSLAAEYPLLTVAAGAGIGLLIGAILPKGIGGKFGKRALSAAVVAGELGIALSRQAGEAAAEAGRDGLRQVEEGAGAVRRHASRSGSAARDAGAMILSEALKYAAKIRR